MIIVFSFKNAISIINHFLCFFLLASEEFSSDSSKFSAFSSDSSKFSAFSSDSSDFSSDLVSTS